MLVASGHKKKNGKKKKKERKRGKLLFVEACAAETSLEEKREISSLLLAKGANPNLCSWGEVKHSPGPPRGEVLTGRKGRKWAVLTQPRQGMLDEVYERIFPQTSPPSAPG